MMVKENDIKNSQISNIISNEIVKTNDEKDPLTWKCWQKRRYIIAFLMLLAYNYLYIARVTMSIAIGIMLEGHEVVDENGTIYNEYDFEWDEQSQGQILSGYFYGYLLTMFPGGILAPIIGGHRLFGIGIGMGSIMQSLTPLAAKQGIWWLFINQVLIGAFGGVIVPCTQAIFSKWAPPSERSRMNMMAFSGEFLGMVIASYGSGLIGIHFGWETIFYFFGILGIIWWINWIWTVKKDPNSDKKCSKDEADYISKSLGTDNNDDKINHPWKKILTSVPVWGIVAANTACNAEFFFCITFLPKYLKDVYSISTENVGLMASVCYAISGILAPLAGYSADKLQQKTLTKTQTRRYFTCFTFLVQIILFTLVAIIDHPIITPTLFIAGAAITVFAFPGYVVNALDLAPKHSSVLVGMSNGIGTIPGAICPMIAGYILQNSPAHYSLHTRWSFIFYIVNSIVFIGGTIFWFTVSGELQDWAK